MDRVIRRRCQTLTPPVAALAAPTYALARPLALERLAAPEAVAGLGDVGAFRLGLRLVLRHPRRIPRAADAANRTAHGCSTVSTEVSLCQRPRLITCSDVEDALLRQLSWFLHCPQTRSPDHALSNDVLHLRHWRVFVALARTNTGFECSDIQEAYRASDQLEVPRTEDRGGSRLNRCRQQPRPPPRHRWGPLRALRRARG